MSGCMLGAEDTAVTQTETIYTVNKYVITNCDKNSESVPKIDYISQAPAYKIEF